MMNLDGDRRATWLGILAIAMWSTSIAFSRSLTEQLGTLTAAGLIYTLAGILACLQVVWIDKTIKEMFRLPRLYLWGCGAMFVTYITFFYLSIGLVSNREQVILVGLINYLWPGLSLVFSLPILGKQSRWTLLLGMASALFGIWLTTTGGGAFSWRELFGSQHSLLLYLLILIAAILWGLYSNLSRRWAGGSEVGAVPLFLLASGLLLLPASLYSNEKPHWSWEAIMQVGFMACFPAFLAYKFWDTAMRRGNMILVASLSYLTPVLSTIVSVVVLKIEAGISLWAGALLVVAGALVCKFSIKE